MFALFSGLWKYLFQKDEYCILILGLDNAGKSKMKKKDKEGIRSLLPAVNLLRAESSVKVTRIKEMISILSKDLEC